MSEHPLVSVIMPVYNGGRFFEASVRSIMAQTLRDLELIVIDDGSTDETPTILDKLAAEDSRIVAIHQENRGIILAPNRAIHIAKGKYIARMDADDISLPTRLERQIAAMESTPKIVLCGTANHIIDQYSQIKKTIYRPTVHEDIVKALNSYMCFCHSSMVMRKSATMIIGAYRTCFNAAEDYDLCLRLIEQGEAINLAEPLVLYREHEANLSDVRCKEIILLSLVAQAASRMRRNGFRDPINNFDTVCPELLDELDLDAKTIANYSYEPLIARAHYRLGIGQDKRAVALGRGAMSFATNSLQGKRDFAILCIESARHTLTKAPWRSVRWIFEAWLASPSYFLSRVQLRLKPKQSNRTHSPLHS